MIDRPPLMGAVGEVLERAKQAAVDYYRLTGKPLGITGEVGEYTAARLLGLTLADARAPGYDAIDAHGRCYQIKTRAVDDQGVAGKDPVFGYAAALDRDEECRRRTLYEMIVEAKARRGGDCGEHQAMPVNFPCRRQRRSAWFGGRIHPAHRFKITT